MLVADFSFQDVLSVKERVSFSIKAQMHLHNVHCGMAKVDRAYGH